MTDQIHYIHLNPMYESPRDITFKTAGIKMPFSARINPLRHKICAYTYAGLAVTKGPADIMPGKSFTSYFPFRDQPAQPLSRSGPSIPVSSPAGFLDVAFADTDLTTSCPYRRKPACPYILWLSRVSLAEITTGVPVRTWIAASCSASNSCALTVNTSPLYSVNLAV